jgi:hypothetical protein
LDAALFGLLVVLVLAACSGDPTPASPVRLAADRPTFLYFYTDA